MLVATYNSQVAITTMLSAQISELVAQGCDSGQVAEALGVSEVAVKAVVADKIALDFSDEDLGAAIDTLGQVARYGENERNRTQASMFIYEVKKGLKVAKNNDRQLPLTQINQLIIAANDDIARFATRKSVGRRDCDIIEGVQDTQVANCRAPAQEISQEIARGAATSGAQGVAGKETTAGTLGSI